MQSVFALGPMGRISSIASQRESGLSPNALLGIQTGSIELNLSPSALAFRSIARVQGACTLGVGPMVRRLTITQINHDLSWPGCRQLPQRLTRAKYRGKFSEIGRTFPGRRARSLCYPPAPLVLPIGNSLESMVHRYLCGLGSCPPGQDPCPPGTVGNH